MDLLGILKSYVQLINTDYAILINGGWGSGKTYFIKESFKKELNEILIEIPDKGEKPFELVYVSLYGITSADEIEKKLVLEMNPFLKNKALGFASRLLKKGVDWAGIDINEDDEKAMVSVFGKIPINKVIVFDDLERLESSTLNEVMGYINSFTEHRNVKVIIVADEKILSEKVKSYEKVKEKLIRFTYTFNPNLNEVYESFLSRYPQLYSAYMLSQKNFICDLFQKGKHRNLRTLRFVLDLFEPIYSSVNIFDGEASLINKGSILKRLLFFVVTYSIQYKRNSSEKYLLSLKELSSDLTQPRFNRKALSKLFMSDLPIVSKPPEAEEDELKKFRIEFDETFLTEDAGLFEYYDYLVEFIHSGDLNERSLKECCYRLNDVMEVNKARPEIIAYQKLSNCLVLEDEEFDKLILELKSYINDGKYDLKSYPEMFQVFLNISSYGIKGLIIDEDLVKIFKEGMAKSVNISEYVYEIEFNLEGLSQENAFANEIRAEVVKLNSTLQFKNEKREAEILLKLLHNNEIDEFTNELIKEEHKRVPVFKYLTAEDFCNVFEKLSNADKMKLNQAISDYTGKYAYYGELITHEKQFYEGLVEELSKRTDEVPIKASIGFICLKRLKILIERRVLKA